MRIGQHVAVVALMIDVAVLGYQLDAADPDVNAEPRVAVEYEVGGLHRVGDVVAIDGVTLRGRMEIFDVYVR